MVSFSSELTEYRGREEEAMYKLLYFTIAHLLFVNIFCNPKEHCAINFSLSLSFNFGFYSGKKKIKRYRTYFRNFQG